MSALLIEAWSVRRHPLFLRSWCGTAPDAQQPVGNTNENVLMLWFMCMNFYATSM
jgi:hypothetical protein